MMSANNKGSETWDSRTNAACDDNDVEDMEMVREDLTSLSLMAILAVYLRC